jgi:uncharacterized protein (TIGR02391 family)
MLEWFLAVNAILRGLRMKVIDAQSHLNSGDSKTADVLNGYIKIDYQSLWRVWEEAGFPTREFGNLGRHIGFGEAHDYEDILQRDLPAVEAHAEKHAREAKSPDGQVGFEGLLHPVVFEHAYQQYQNGHLRDAVLNSVVAVFDLIRERTGLKNDGQALISEALSLDKPRLILSELESESGRNDQKGFLQILTGAYIGIRNPKAHSLRHDLDENKAIQYLLFASLLARRISEAKIPKSAIIRKVRKVRAPARSVQKAP